MSYFLKLLGLTKSGLPEIWWEERPEIVSGVFLEKRPRQIQSGDRLIYYAVGGGKRVVAEVEVVGNATRDFEPPPDWTRERRLKFPWRMPVKLLAHYAADSSAPRAADFYPRLIKAGSYRRLTDEQGRGMAEAIRARGRT